MDRLLWRWMTMVRYIATFRTALWQALAHDVLNTAKATAYSGMLMLFPALVVLTTLLALVPEGTTFTGELRAAFDQFLPVDTMYLIQSSLEARRIHSVQLIFSGASLSVFASLGVMLSLMEGFRRAYRLPQNVWGFWAKRMRALMLVPISMGPLALATLLLVFGRQIEAWMVTNAIHELRTAVLVGWRLARWTLALVTCVSVLIVLYHFGTKRTEKWTCVAPGAVTATLVWFPATLAFGWYVTRIADYSLFYGSFGAGIATLVWLYITAFSALLGAELNGTLYRDRQEQMNGERLAGQISRPDGLFT